MFERYFEFLERAEFLSKGDIDKLQNDKNNKVVIYNIPIFNKRLTVYHNSLMAFKGIYGITPNFEGYEVNTDSNNNFVITILSDLTIKEKTEWIFKKTYSVVIKIVESLGIQDNETEAYLFGYLIKQILIDFIPIKDLLLNIEEKTLIKGTLVSMKFVMLSSGIYKDKELKVNYKITDTASGTVQMYKGRRELIMMIPRSKNKKYTKQTILEVWSHELYHMARNSYGLMNRHYYWIEDILIEYMNISLPILKKVIWKKVV